MSIKTNAILSRRSIFLFINLLYDLQEQFMSAKSVNTNDTKEQWRNKSNLYYQSIIASHQRTRPTSKTVQQNVSKHKRFGYACTAPEWEITASMANNHWLASKKKNKRQ